MSRWVSENASMKRELGMPDNILPYCAVAVGYPAGYEFTQLSEIKFVFSFLVISVDFNVPTGFHGEFPE